MTPCRVCLRVAPFDGCNGGAFCPNAHEIEIERQEQKRGRRKRDLAEHNADDPRMAQLALHGREALAAAQAVFGNLIASDTTAEAMCGYIEERLREHGLDVSVRYVFVEDPLDGALQRAGFRRVGDGRQLRFTLAPRWDLPVFEVKVKI